MHHKYPKWKYNGDQSCIVQTAAEEKALGVKWTDSPVKPKVVKRKK